MNDVSTSSISEVNECSNSISKIDYFNQIIEKNNQKLSENVFSNNWEHIKSNRSHQKK